MFYLGDRISNLGMFGISEFSAIINPPQCGILAVGGSRLALGRFWINQKWLPFKETKLKAPWSNAPIEYLQEMTVNQRRWWVLLYRTTKEPLILRTPPNSWQLCGICLKLPKVWCLDGPSALWWSRPSARSRFRRGNFVGLLLILQYFFFCSRVISPWQSPKKRHNKRGLNKTNNCTIIVDESRRKQDLTIQI